MFITIMRMYDIIIYVKSVHCCWADIKKKTLRR